MDTSIQIFKNDRFGEVRVTEIEGKTYFVGSDVAKALGYANPADAVATHCKSGNIAKRYVAHNNGTGGVYVNYIPEGDVYRLVAKSQLPGAEEFEAWIFDDVLPTMRKTGGYMLAGVDDTPDVIMARALVIAQDTISRVNAEKERLLFTTTEQAKQLEAQAPKVLFANAVSTSDRSVLVSELAKVLKQNGVETGQNRLFIWLRENGYLCSKGEYYNQPTQRAMEMGLFELKKTSITKPDGSVLVTVTTKVTGKGQIYFVNKFLKKQAA